MPRTPSPEGNSGYEPDADWGSQPISFEQSGGLTCADMDQFLATF